jgi:hypothetical protein
MIEYMMNENDNFKNEFLETSYIIHLEKEVILKIGEPPTELLNYFPKIKSWAFITGWNPLPNILPLDQNKIRNSELLALLKAANYETYSGIGISKDEKWSEASFFIVNIDLATAHSISSKFGQLAFLYGDRERGNQLMFTNIIDK